VAVTACEPASITDARNELQDGPARTAQLSLPVARDTFYVDSVFTDFLGVSTVTLSDGLLAVEVAEGNFGLDVGAVTGPVSGPLPPVMFSVQDGVRFLSDTLLNLGEFEDAARDATLNTAFAVVTVVNEADAPATLTDFLIGVVRIDSVTGNLDSAGGQPDWQTDGTGTPIRVPVADPGVNTFAVPRSGTALDTLFSAALVDRLVDMLLDGEWVALVGAGDVTVGDGSNATISATDELLVTLKPVIGFDFTLPPAGVTVDSSLAEKGLRFDDDDADDIAARTDSAVVTLDIENSTSLGVEATIIAVADSLTDAFSAPAQDQIPIDVVTVAPGQVDAQGRVTQATAVVTGVNLSGAEARAFMGEWFTAGIRLRLFPPPGGRSAIRTGDWVGVSAIMAIHVTNGGGTP
jgi:hypothetical protein